MWLSAMDCAFSFHNTLLICLGTLAAAYQSAFLGNLTPAGSLFAKLQSMGMLGTLLPAQIGIAVAIAALVSSVVWACSEGRE